MDSVGLSVFFFMLIKVALWATFIVWLICLVYQISLSVFSRDRNQETPFDILWGYKFRITLTVIVFIMMVYWTAAETSYRPKTKLKTSNWQLEQRKERIDKKAQDKITNKQPTYAPPIVESWVEVEKKNREENKKAQEEFLKLE